MLNSNGRHPLRITNMANMYRQIIPKRDMIRFLYRRKQEMTDKKLIAIADAKKDDHEKIMITTSFHIIVRLHYDLREKITVMPLCHIPLSRLYCSIIFSICSISSWPASLESTRADRYFIIPVSAFGLSTISFTAFFCLS